MVSQLKNAFLLFCITCFCCTFFSHQSQAQNTGVEEDFFAESVAEDVEPPTPDEIMPEPSAKQGPADVPVDILADSPDKPLLSPADEQPAEVVAEEPPSSSGDVADDDDEIFADDSDEDNSFIADDEKIDETIPEFDEPVSEAEPLPTVSEPEPEERVEFAPVDEGNTPISEPKELTVIVDPSNAVRVNYQTRRTIILPYSQRRKKWGSVHGLSAGTPSPNDFEPNFLTSTFDEVYSGSADAKAIEYHSNYKRNFGSYSTGIEFNVGTYTLKSDRDLIDSELTVTYLKLGGQLALDNLFEKHPYMVPYVSGGIYTMTYAEELGSTSNNGNTEVSFYGSAGLMLDISWIDKHSADSGYFESGIENTFLFAEASFYSQSQNEQDPNFEGLHMNAGIKVEF